MEHCLEQVLTLISILIAIRIGKKQLMQQKKDSKKIYYERLLGSLGWLQAVD